MSSIVIPPLDLTDIQGDILSAHSSHSQISQVLVADDFILLQVGPS